MDQQGKLDTIIVAALAHYNFVRIHPFSDGNGRGARILMNLILMEAGMIPAVVQKKNRREYLNTIELANQGDLAPFVQFISRSIYETVKSVVEDFKQAKNES